MWRNFSMWQSFPTFIMWRNFPLDNMSWRKFLHMTNFFSTDAVCGVCDKYQVCPQSGHICSTGHFLATKSKKDLKRRRFPSKYTIFPPKYNFGIQFEHDRIVHNPSIWQNIKKSCFGNESHVFLVKGKLSRKTHVDDDPCAPHVKGPVKSPLFQHVRV